MYLKHSFNSILIKPFPFKGFSTIPFSITLPARMFYVIQTPHELLLCALLCHCRHKHIYTDTPRLILVLIGGEYVIQ